jgi:hypothetical protein
MVDSSPKKKDLYNGIGPDQYRLKTQAEFEQVGFQVTADKQV